MRSTGHEQQDYYTSIDGNPLKNPTAYCTHYHGYLSERLIKVHRCRKKHGGACARLQNMKGENIRRMNQTQFFDRLIDRMDKMIVAMNKLSKTLEAMQKVKDGMIVSLTDAPNEYDRKPDIVSLTDASNVHLEAIDSDSSYGKITIE